MLKNARLAVSLIEKIKKSINWWVIGQNNVINASMSSWNTTVFGTNYPSTWPNVNTQPHTKPMRYTFDLDNELALTEFSTKATVCRSSLPQGHPHRSSDFTGTQQTTREPIGHAGNQLAKPRPRPKVCSMHHNCPQQPRASRLSNQPFTRPQVEANSKRMPQRGERCRDTSAI
jgi:hypothetical protein